MAQHLEKLHVFAVLLLLISLLAARAQDGGGSSQNGQTDFGLPETTDNCYCLEQEIGSASLNVTGNCTYSVPGLPENFQHSFREIATSPRQAVLTLTWDKPENHSALCHYEVRIRGTSSDSGCSETDDIIFMINKDSSELTLTTANLTNGHLSLSLLYDCRYQVAIASYPGNESITEDIFIEYNESSMLSLKSFAIYKPESTNYDIFVYWFLDNPLAMEAAAVNGYRVRLRNGILHLNMNEESTKASNFTFKDRDIIVPEPGIENYLVEVEFICLPRKFGTPFFWRNPLLRMSCATVPTPYQRHVDALPQPPTSLEFVQVDEADYLPSKDTLSVTISWGPPLYPNGALKHYELRIGTAPVLPEQNSSEAGTVLKLTEIMASETNFSNDILIKKENANKTLYVQIRSKNIYKLYSNWSEAVTIDLLNVTVTEPTIVSPTSIPVQLELPPYAYALVGVALLVLLLVVMVLVCLVCTYVRNHYCLHMGPEMMPMGKSTFGYLVKERSRYSHINDTHSQVDEWEVAENEIIVLKDQPLGEGCFGKVFKGMLMGKSLQNRPKGNFRPPGFSLTCIVAVKQLKSDAHGSDKESFFKEMRMMKMVSRSDNEMKKFVVNMIGCVTVREPLLLIVEYVRHGDLQTFLRTIKKQTVIRFVKQQSEAAPYLEPEGAYSKLNPTKDNYAELGALEERNLLEFARQIAAGMEFLSGLGVIHRDLACRNILIGEQKNLKISDFGMSRYLPKDEVYVPMSHGLLPLRWMAIESIHAREFTTASDTWSYGVVLWELCTMCEFPYKSIPNQDLLGYLKRGYRMPKPSNCSPEVYDIMLQCWREEQVERPSFSELLSQFDQFLSVYVQDYYPYIELQSSNHYDRLHSEATNQPINNTDNLLSGSCNATARDVQTKVLTEDQVSLGLGGSSPPEGGAHLEGNGNAQNLNSLPQQNGNSRSNSTQLLRLSVSNQDLRSASSSMNHLDLIGRQGIQSLPTERGGSFRSLNEIELVDLRYVESPVAALSRSSDLTTSELSIPEVMNTRFGKNNTTTVGGRGSHPDCSEEKRDDGRAFVGNDELRSNSFSTADQRKTFKREIDRAAN